MTTIGGANVKKGRLGDEVSVNIDIPDKGEAYEACLNFRGIEPLGKKGRQVILSLTFEGEQLDRFVDGMIKARNELRRNGKGDVDVIMSRPPPPPPAELIRKKPRRVEEMDVLVRV